MIGGIANVHSPPDRERENGRERERKRRGERRSRQPLSGDPAGKKMIEGLQKLFVPERKREEEREAEEEKRRREPVKE